MGEAPGSESLTEIESGHCMLNRHLLIIGVNNQPARDQCGFEKRAEHFVAVCIGYSIMRYRNMRLRVNLWMLNI